MPELFDPAEVFKLTINSIWTTFLKVVVEREVEVIPTYIIGSIAVAIIFFVGVIAIYQYNVPYKSVFGIVLTIFCGILVMMIWFSQQPTAAPQAEHNRREGNQPVINMQVHIYLLPCHGTLADLGARKTKTEMKIEETIEKYGMYPGISVAFVVLISTTLIKTDAEKIVAYIVIGGFWFCGMACFGYFECGALAGGGFTGYLAVLAAAIWSNNRQPTAAPEAEDNRRQANQPGRYMQEQYELTDAGVWNLATAITSVAAYMRLGYALERDNHALRSIMNNATAITIASHRMLMT